MNGTINKRIAYIIEQSGKSLTSYAKQIGISQASLRDIVINDSSPKWSTVEKIIKAEPLINTHWLLTGEGSMKKDDNLQPAHITAENSIVGDGNSNNNVGSADESFFKGIISELRNTIADLRSRCSDFERQNQELEKLLNEERERNKQFPIRFVD